MRGVCGVRARLPARTNNNLSAKWSFNNYIYTHAIKGTMGPFQLPLERCYRILACAKIGCFTGYKPACNEAHR